MNLKKEKPSSPIKGRLYRAYAPRNIYFATLLNDRDILSICEYDPKIILMFLETVTNQITKNISHKCLYKNKIGFIVGVGDNDITFSEQKN